MRIRSVPAIQARLQNTAGQGAAWRQRNEVSLKHPLSSTLEVPTGGNSVYTIGQLTAGRHEDLIFILNAAADIEYLLKLLDSQLAGMEAARKEADHWKALALGEEGTKITANSVIAALIEVYSQGEASVSDEQLAQVEGAEVVVIRSEDDDATSYVVSWPDHGQD